MPAFDFPLDKLRAYTGTNPLPSDFDAFWDRALAELDATPPRAELIPCREFQPNSAEFFSLYFQGVRGARIHAKYARPKQRATKSPAVLLFHGYSGASPDWGDLLRWTAEGYCVAALDCRGQGGLSEDTGGVRGNTLNGHIIRGLNDHEDNLLFRHIYLDTVQKARILRGFDEIDPDHLYAHGGSQGGALTLACAALDPGIRKAASVFPFLSDFQRVWDMDLAKDAYRELVDYLRRFDPRHERIMEMWTRLGYLSIHNLAPRIRGEVLLFTGLMDQICPPSTQFAAFNRMTCAKEMVLYPDFGHEHLPGHGDRTLAFFQA